MAKAPSKLKYSPQLNNLSSYRTEEGKEAAPLILELNERRRLAKVEMQRTMSSDSNNSDIVPPAPQPSSPVTPPPIIPLTAPLAFLNPFSGHSPIVNSPPPSPSLGEIKDLLSLMTRMLSTTGGTYVPRHVVSATPASPEEQQKKDRNSNMRRSLSAPLLQIQPSSAEAKPFVEVIQQPDSGRGGRG